MKNSILLLICFFLSFLSFSQIGINNVDPKATLDVTGTPTVITVPDGVIPPRITRAELINKTAYSTDQLGAILFVTDLSGTVNTATANITEVGYYYFDGSNWQKIAGPKIAEYGQIIQALWSSDFNGYVKLDGRAKTSLTANQQAQATALGIGANLPLADNTPEYLYAKLSSTIANVVQTLTNFTAVAGNMTINSGVVTLKANKIYDVECIIGAVGTPGYSAYAFYELQNATTGVILPSANSGFFGDSRTISYGDIGDVATKALIKPTVDTDIRVTITSCSTSGNIDSVKSFLKIVQIDSFGQSIGTTSTNTFIYLGN
ncbi:hypothetical protein [Flavobacterium piscis]|uniref:Uncharacterized protein n=1 Tax=Flavobacterium piscis TaxID=1114874 RepID=A0ABU1Y7B2_9FLAO|nr:hypothetical protein [Flavobacterium piscis]MDR7209386.1 hypothetical protein [Flavobacterium piscis]